MIWKIFFCKNKHYIVAVVVPNFHFSARSSSFFLAFFSFRLWRTFLRNTLYFQHHRSSLRPPVASHAQRRAQLSLAKVTVYIQSWIQTLTKRWFNFKWMDIGQWNCALRENHLKAVAFSLRMRWKMILAKNPATSLLLKCCCYSSQSLDKHMQKVGIIPEWLWWIVETSHKPAGLHVVINGFQRNGADFNGSVLLDENGIAGEIAMNNSTIAIPVKNKYSMQQDQRCRQRVICLILSVFSL